MPFESLGHSTTYKHNAFARLHSDKPADDIMQSIENNMEIDNNAAATQLNAAPDALDPDHSERKYHRHPYTGQQREIWRPGTQNDYFAAALPFIMLTHP